MKVGQSLQSMRRIEEKRKKQPPKKKSNPTVPHAIQEDNSGDYSDYSGRMKVEPVLKPEEASEIGLDAPFVPYNHTEQAVARAGSKGVLPPTMTTMPDALDPATAAAIAVLRIRQRNDLMRPQGAPDLQRSKLLAPDKPRPLWEPFPNSPQERAYISEADELFYGGAAGGGKSWLGLGLAITSHWNSLVLRREATQVKDLVADSKEIVGKAARYNGSINTWYFPEGRRIEFGGCETEDDKRKYKGRGKDLYVFDEVSDFLESQYIYITTWNRSARPNQRCRIVCTGNPPTGPEGQWVIKRWAPWLDPTYPSPALPGELRWFATLDGKDVEVSGPQAFEHKAGKTVELIRPRSRTFIPALLEDNPILNATDYRAKLQSLPEPWRSQLLYGDFNLKTADSPWQVIPTAWIRAAMDRWKPERPLVGGEDGTERRQQPLTSVGVDVARGGADKTVLAPRYGLWYDVLQKYDGSATDDAPSVVALFLPLVTSGGTANIDGIGVGSGVVDISRAYIGTRTNSILFSSGSAEMDQTGTFGFVNLRAQAYWQFREALDPRNPNPISLPPDQELLTDLAAATYRPQMGGIKIESKEDIKKRLGRSPDCADAVVLASLQGARAPHIYGYTLYH